MHFTILNPMGCFNTSFPKIYVIQEVVYLKVQQQCSVFFVILAKEFIEIFCKKILPCFQSRMQKRY